MTFFISEEVLTLPNDNDFLNDAKTNIIELAGSLSVSFDDITYDYENNMFQWSGSFGDKIKWLFTMGKGNSGFYLENASMLRLEPTVLQALLKLQGYFNVGFTKAVNEKLAKKDF